MNLNDTPRADRLHIGLFGRRNSGKSSLINALTSQNVSVVSDVPGTTTDPVYKSMEIPGIGPVVFIDTAGFDDIGALGDMRVEKTKGAAEKTDVALIVLSSMEISTELQWIADFKTSHTPCLVLINKADLEDIDINSIQNTILEKTGEKPLCVSAKTGLGIEAVRLALTALIPEDYDAPSITGNLVKKGDSVLLVMPQDIEAPKGRLILPQVQTLRELLDKKCIVTCCTADELEQTLVSLKKPPCLIITDSQVFQDVYDKKPETSKLTSFSVLFASYKGDLDYYVKSASALDSLTEDSHILIAEACTHAPLSEDIGRVKIPQMLRKKVGEGLSVDLVSGADFPEDLSPYDLIIQCGACMFNQKHVLSRIARAKSQNIPMSNYGIVIAYLKHIIDKIELY